MPTAADVPPCPAAPRSRPPGQRSNYRISTITPVFGGGVVPGTPDPELPVRATAVRGQLQFWWRATVGASCAGFKELFARSTTIWGTTSKASQVEVEVVEVQASASTPCAAYDEHNGRYRLEWNPKVKPLAYALFPFQGQPPKRGTHGPEKAPGNFVERLAFTLKLSYPSALQHDVETAVWAWVNFGGLGARTRRGCGALRCVELAPKSVEDLPSWFRAHRTSSKPSIREWPTLPADIRVGDETDPMRAWRACIDQLRQFRQGLGFARNVHGGKPGRSRYPEPEAIRAATRRSERHPRLPYMPPNAFPRAELGLPIVFHFNQRPVPGDPADTVLYPRDAGGKQQGRLASPLILKPLAVGEHDAVPLVMRLQTPPLSSVVLTEGGRELELPTPVLRGANLGRYRDSPLHRSPQGSALDAFMRGLNGFAVIR